MRDKGQAGRLILAVIAVQFVIIGVSDAVLDLLARFQHGWD